MSIRDFAVRQCAAKHPTDMARSGRCDLAHEAYGTAIRLSGTEAERQFLTERLRRLG